jgi:L,D-transpeptidase catalytic domain
MGTAAYSDRLTDWPGGGVIGVHGTSEPGLIPGSPSHGCIRVRNPDMERLYAKTPIGTPVLIKGRARPDRPEGACRDPALEGRPVHALGGVIGLLTGILDLCASPYAGDSR